MNGNGESRTDGGKYPAETGAECREDSGRSASSSLDELMTEDETVKGETEGEKTGEEEESGEAESAPRTERRRAREEVENEYRNNPLFATLFDKTPKKRKVVPFVKIGGLRITPNRFLILCGFFLIVLLCLGICFYYAFADLGKIRHYAQAKSLFESGDYEGAKKMFIKVLNADPNKEEAVAALADIYNHFGDWNNEAFFRQRLMRLNPLEPKYFHAFMESAFRAGNYDVIYSHLRLKVMDGGELPHEDGALYLIAALRSGHVQDGKMFYRERKDVDSDYFSGSERGRFAERLVITDRMDGDRARDFSAFLEEVQDPQIRFETILVLVSYYSQQTDPESEAKTEELLRNATELNDFVGAPLLANYYFSRYRFDDVAKVCEKYLETKANAFMPLLLGESYVLGGHPERIPEVSRKMSAMGGGRQSKMISSYLNALSAFCDGDIERLHGCLLESGSTIVTPLSSLMKLQVAILTDSSKEILVTLAEIMKNRPYMDFPQRARTAALGYLMEKADGDLASDQEMLDVCAEIASLIQTKNDDVSFLRRIIVLDRFNRYLLREEEIQDALATFPGDIVFLRIAAQYYLDHEMPGRAMEYITAYNALPIQDKPSIAVLNILALHQLKRNDEAEKEFRTLLESGGDDSLLFPYYEFCVENKFLDSLKSLAGWIEKKPADSKMRSSLPFIRAEILLADGNLDQAFELFSKSNADDPRFIFHAAERLCDPLFLEAVPGKMTADRDTCLNTAVSRLLSVQNAYPDKVRLNLLLSKIYSMKGDAESALSTARAAWQQKPGDLRARSVYGTLLFDAGQYAETIKVLDFPQYRLAFPAATLQLWHDAMLKELKADFEAARYLPALEKAKHFLIYFPDDEEVREYSRKIEEARRQEKRGGK